MAYQIRGETWDYLHYTYQTSKSKISKTIFNHKLLEGEQMEIAIGENFRVVSDDNNYTLQERLSNPYKYKDKVTGEEKVIEWKSIGSFNRLKHLYKHLFELKVRRIDVVEIRAVLTEMKNIKAEVEKHFIDTEPKFR